MHVSLKNINDRIFNIKNEDEFQRISLEVFNYQIKNNDLYRKFSSLTLKNKKPKKAEEIPFLPIDFFKTNEISSKCIIRLSFKHDYTGIWEACPPKMAANGN